VAARRVLGRPTVSVVICAYTEERWERLVDAVESARRQSAPPLEIIVVADHNRALLARIRSALEDVVAVESSGTRGLSGARNSGVAAARGDIVAFLDDDAVADPEWLASLLAGYADTRVAGVGGAVEPRWLDGRPGGFPAEFDWVVGCSYRGLPEATAPVRNLIGANMSIRRDVVLRAGGFRTSLGRVGRLPAGCEETELCIRVQQRMHGRLFIYEPRARVRHAVPAERATWRYFGSRCVAEGVSKAQVAAAAGRGAGLASERRYVRRTLPSAVLRDLRAGARGDPAGLLRATAIVSGLLLTTAGYVGGRGLLRAGAIPSAGDDPPANGRPERP
jgi:glucosyl-dolichyl phosphate glucuronosyltransferase